MENVFKRFLSLAMAVLLVFSNIPASVFASEACAHENKITISVAATCTEAGKDTVTCSDCGETISTQETAEATGHNYVDGLCACGAEDPDYIAPVNEEETEEQPEQETETQEENSEETPEESAPCTETEGCTLDKGHDGDCIVSEPDEQAEGDYVAEIGEDGFATLAEALSTASAMTGDVVVEIYDKVTLSQSLSGSYDSIKFVGKDTGAEIYLDVQGYITATGKKVAFESLILSKSQGVHINNAGFMNVAFGVYDVVEVTYTDCTFANGAYASSGKVTYTNCTFQKSWEKYGLWAYGNVDVTVNGGTFDNDRGIKMYAEGAAKTVDLTVKGADFSKLTGKPAIVLTYGESVTLEGNIYSDTGVLELDLDGAPNGTPVTSTDAITCVNDNGDCGVLVDGKIYTTVAQAAEAATSGSTVTLLHDSTETVELPMGVTLEKNGFEAAGVTVKQPKNVATEAELVDALNDGEESVILSADITLADKATLTISNCVLDLGGHTLTLNGESGKLENATIQNGAIAITTYDGDTVADGLFDTYGACEINDVDITSSECVIYAIFDIKTGTLEMNDSNIDISNNSSAGGLLYFNGGDKLVMNDCTVTGTDIGDFLSNGVAELNNCTITLTGTTSGALDNGINGTALTLNNTNITVDGATGRGITTDGDDININGTSQVNLTNCGEGGIRFKASANIIVVSTASLTTTVKVDSAATEAKINDTPIAVTTDELPVAKVQNGTVTVKFAPKGNDFTGYTRGDAIWGETWGNATESFVIKVLDANGNVMGTTSLNNIDGIIDGDLTVTWSLKLDAESNTDGYWTMNWTTAPTIDNQPAKVELWVDGTKVSGGDVVLNGPDNINVINSAVADADGKILSYHKTLADAVAAAESGATIAILRAGDYTLPEFANKELTFVGVDKENTSITDWVNKGSQGMTGSTVHFKDLTIKGQTENYYGLFHTAGVTYENCNINGLRFLYAPTVSFEDCAFNAEGVEHSFWTYGASNVTVTNCTFNYTDRAVNCYSENGADHELDIAFSDCTFTYEGTSDAPEGAVEINSGSVTSIDLTMDNCTAPEKGAMWFNSQWDSQKGANTVVTVDGNVVWKPLKGTGTAEDPYLISSVDDLLTFQKKVDEQAADGSTQFAGKYFKLTADLDLSGINWDPIGSMTGDHGSFKGIFDGDGHTISNLNVQQAGNGLGLFARTAGNAEIKNLTLNNVTVKSTNNSNYVGAVVGNSYASTKITNVHVTGNIDISGRGYIGGISGHGYVVMDNVSVVGTGTISSTFWCAGGILGYGGEGATNIMNAHVEGITITSAAGGLGAIVGMAEDNDGTQPISGSNLSAKNVEIKTYTGAYGDSYANYALGYLYGGNPTSKLTGNLSVENVKVETSSGEAPKVNDAVATIGDKVYFDLQSAVNAGGEVVVLRDIVLTDTVTVPADKTVTLDLNGNTISQSKACTESYQMIANNGTLTITGNGKLSFTDTGAGDPTYSWGSYTIRNSGTLVVENGTIEHLGTQTPGTHCVQAIFQYSGSTTINGGTISTPNYRSVRLWSGDMTINGGTFEGQVWVHCVNDTSKLTITGGTFAPAGRDGSSVFVNNSGYESELSVTGGTFTTKIGANDVDALAGAITGGIFTEAAVSGTNAALLDENMKFQQKDDGTYVVAEKLHLTIIVSPVATMDAVTITVATMDEAVAYALANPADSVTYQITGPVELTTGSAHGIIELGNNVTIEGVTDEAKLTIVGGGVPDFQGVTFKNITIADEGTYAPDANEFMYQNFIDCTFENCTFEEGIRVSGNTTLTNCTINSSKNDQYALWSDGGKVTMTGSTVIVDGQGYGMVKSDNATEYVLTNNTFEYLNAANKEALNTNGATITATGNKFIGCTEGVIPADKTNYAADGTTLTEDAITADNDVFSYVAVIGDVKYKTLADAVAAADGKTVKLLSDVSVATLTIESGKNVTIDLNGNDLTLTPGMQSATVTVNGELTLTGEGDVTVAPQMFMGMGFNVPAGGKLTLDTDGNVALSANAIGSNLASVKGEIVINSGDFTTGFNTGDNATITITGGTFTTLPIEKRDNDTRTISVSGGTFPAAVPEEWVAEGMIPAENADGTFGVKVGSYVARVDGKGYESLTDAFKAATSGCTIEILSDVTISEKWDCRDYATNGSHSQFKEAVTINGNGHIIKFTGTINDNNWNTVFRFEEDATVQNLTIDISEATGAQRVITAKKSLTVDGLTIIGSAKYGVIFGEGSSAADLAAAEIVIKNSDLTGTRRAISDNEGGKDVKSVVITGNTLNADVYVSASEAVTFTDNTVKSGYVDIRSYSAENVLDVTATGNTLTANTETSYNYIYAKTIDAQDEFVVKHPPFKVSTKAELNAALSAAQEGDTILLIADIDYGTDQLKIEKPITLDLGGKTLTTRNAYGGMSVKNDPTIKNGTIVHASNTAAIKVWNATAFEDLVIDVQGKGDANKTIGGIVLQSGTTTRVDSIKNVTIKGDALTNGIETYNCGDAAENVIGSMENVNIDANGTAMLISAPVGTATGCTFDGGVNAIELWIKGNYSASLTLADCDVIGTVSVHDEFNSNPGIVNNGTLTLTVDPATTGVTPGNVTLTINHAEEKQVKGKVLEDIIANAQAKVNGTYYASLLDALTAAKDGETVTMLADVELTTRLIFSLYTAGRNVTLDGNGHRLYASSTNWGTGNGKHLINVNCDNVTLKDIVLDCNNIAEGANIYKAQNIVFDNVSIINKKGWNADLTVNGSTLTVRNKLSASYVDVSLGKNVTTPLGIVAEEGAVLETRTLQIASAAYPNTDLDKALSTDGTSYYSLKKLDANGNLAGYSNSLSRLSNGYSYQMLEDMTVNSNVTLLNAGHTGTLDTNGHTLTIADGKALTVNGDLTVVGEGTIVGKIILGEEAALTAPAGLNVETVDGYVLVYSNGVYVSAEVVATIGDVPYTSLDDAFAAAKDGDEVKIQKAGTYALTTSGKNITITGAVADVVFDNIGAKNMGGANVTFNNVTFDYYPNVNYTGLQHSGNLVYNNCTINGQVFLYGQSETFNNCIFNQNSKDAYNVWTYGAKEVEFNGCTFNSAGKSVLIYSEDKALFNEVTVTDCDFIASEAVDGKAAIEMDSSLTAGIELTIDEATTATGFGSGNVSGNSLWNNKKGNNTDANNDITVTVAGVEVLKPVTFVAKIGQIGYTTIKAALDAAKADDTVTILAGNYTQDVSVNKAITVIGETDAEGNNLVNITGRVSVSTGATVKNLNVHNEKTGNYDCALSINGKDIVVDGVKLTGYNGLRNCYAKGDVTIKNSTIDASYFALHFDGSDGGNLMIENCAITGWVSYGGGMDKVTLKDSTFYAGEYAGQRSYADEVVIEGSTFEAGYKLDIAKNGTKITVTNSQMEGGSSITTLFNNDDACGQNEITIDGEKLVYVAKIGNTYYATLKDALADVTDWTTIKLTADATLDYNARDVYGRDTTTDIIIDGQGHTLTLNQINSDWSSIGLKKADGKLTLKNMTIEKTGYGDTTGAWNTHAIIFSSNVEMKDVTVNNAIAVQNGATLNNVTINEANGFYGLWINGNGQTVTVNGGSINATNGGRGIKIADQYVGAPASVTLSVTGTDFNTAKKAAVLVSSKAGAAITASNVDIADVAEDNVNFVWVDEDWAAHYGEVTVAGATVAQENEEAMVAAFLDADGNVDSYFKTLQAAIDAAEAGQTVTVIKDVTVSSMVTISKSLTLDLGGNTITGTGAVYRPVKVAGDNSDIEVKITNGTIETKDVTTKPDQAAALLVYDGADVTLENVTLNGSHYGVMMAGYYQYGNGIANNNTTSLKVNNGTVINAANAAIIPQGSYPNVDIEINEGAAVTSTDSIAIYMPTKGNLTVNGGSVTGTTAIYVKCGNLAVKGGTITAKGDKADYVYKTSGADSTGDAIVIESCGYLDGSVPTASITGGTIISANAETVASYAGNGVTEPVKGFITGGIYKTAPADDLLAPGYEVKYDTTSRMFGITTSMVASVNGTDYATLAEAVEAAKNGGTIYLKRDVVLNETVTVPAGAKFTLNLMGKTLNGSIQAKNAEITVLNGSIVNKDPSVSAIEINAGKLTLTDVNIESARHALRIDGAVEATLTRGSYKLITTAGMSQHALNVSGNANVTINKGTFVGPKGTASDSGAAVNVKAGATVIINDGDFSGGKNNTLSAAGTLTVTGGTYDQDPSAYVAKDYKAVKNDEGKYEVVEKVYVVMIGNEGYESFAEALNAVEDGETITILEGATGSELKTEIEFTKDIEFTITGTAPEYALPVITFQNATVNIKDAEILIPELDARQNATINVIDSTVHDAGGNGIVKSYYNGAINISGNSVVHTMQVTTMGYITVSDTAKLNATWQTNVYGNGIITVKDDATFATAALQLTGKDYSGRDNTDADRVGKPAAIVVDGAELIIGKVYSDNGADYSYNSSYGINIGTVDGKSAVLDIKNGATVNVYMANGETANIGANGTVNVDASALTVACRAENGKATLVNKGTVNVSGTSDIAANVIGAGWVYMNGVTLDADTKLLGAKVRFASGINNVDGSVIDDGFFQVGIGAYNGVDANVDTENGVVVNVKNATIGSSGSTYAGWIGTGYYDTDAEKAAAMTDAKYVLNIEDSVAAFGYLHVSNDGELNVKGIAEQKVGYNNSDYTFYAGDLIINGTATFDATDVLALYTKVSCDNGTDKPGTLNIVNGTEYEAERHNGAIGGTNFDLRKTAVVNVEDAELYIGEYTAIAADAVLNVGGDVTALGTITNNGKIYLTALDASITTPEAPEVISGLKDYVVAYENGAYKLVEKAYVAKIGDEGYMTLEAAFAAAEDGDEVKILAAGTYALSTSGKNITITGAVDGVVFDNIGAKNMGSANVTFNNVTFDYYPNVNYTGLQHSGNLVYNNCTINGQVFLYGTSETFNNCTFNQISSDAYNVWTYGAKKVEFNECTFNSAGKSVLIYSEDKALFNNVTVTDCDFIASAPVEGKAAIEMDSSLTNGIKLTIDGETTVTGFGTGNVSGNSLWNNKKDNKTEANNDITVVVDGVTVLEPWTLVAEVNNVKYTTLAAAIAAANAGDTVTLLADVTEDVTVNNNITIEGADKNYTGTMTVNTSLTVTVQNVNFVKGSITEAKGTGGNLTVKNCDFDGVDNTIAYAVTMRGGNSVTMEGCTSKNYDYGMLYVPSAVTNVTVKDTTAQGGGYGVHVAYGTNVTLDNVTMTDVAYGIMTQNYGAKTITIRNSSISGTNPIFVWERNTTVVDTFKFEGENTFSGLTASKQAKLVLAAEDATLTAPEGFIVTTSVENYEVEYDGTKYVAVPIVRVAKINETGVEYKTLQAAIDAATAGNTVTLIADVTENVTVNKDLTIDGANYKYTGNISVNGSTVDAVIKNINFVNGTGYAVTTNTIKSITVENCTVKDYGFGFLYANKSTPTVVVKNVTVNGGNYGMHWVYGTTATLENVTMTGVTYGLHIQNYASKTINLKDCDICTISIWERDGKSGVQTFKFEGSNTVSSLTDSEYAKYVLAATDATLTAAEGSNVTTSVENYEVEYDGTKYVAVPIVRVAKIGETEYKTLQDAIDAAVDGDTIVLISDIDIAQTKRSVIDDSFDTYFLVEGKAITIDLAGHKISGEYADPTNTMLVGVFSTDNNGHLTLTGNGTVDVTATGKVYSLIATYEDGCSITIENGTYTLDKAADCLIYTGCDEGVIVNGGTFTLGNVGTGTNGQPWIFNALGQNVRNVVVNGGTFNADISHNFWANEVYVPETLALKNNGNGTWTVVEAAAYIEEKGTSTGSTVRKVGYATLADAIAAVKNGQTITLVTDNAEDVTIKQVEGLSFTIDGNGKTYSGTITIHGNARYQGEETLTIQNVKFETSEAGHYFIDSNSTGSVERYAHNVTVKDSTFTATGAAVNTAAALRIRQGFDIAIEGVTATDLHSLLQAYGNDGITITDVTVNGKSGISVGTSKNVEITNANITATGYGIRADGTGACNMTVKDSTIVAELPIVVRKNTGAGYQLTVEGNTLTGTNTEGYQVIFTAGDDGEYVAPTVEFTLNTTDSLKVFPKTLTPADVKLDGELIYNGQNQDHNIVAVNGATFTVAGDASAKDAGEYTAIVTGTGSYIGSFEMKWTIAKKAASITIADQTMVAGNNPPAPPQVTYEGVVDGDTLAHTVPAIRWTAEPGTPGTHEYIVTLGENPNYEITVNNGKLVVVGGVASVNGVNYGSLADAIAAAKAGDTIVFLTDITENVTVSKSVTIDGAGKKYTGGIKVDGSTTAITIKNINFVDYTDDYAVTTNRIKSVTIEDCTVKGYDGFLYANKSTPTVVVKNVTMNGGIYGMHWVYGTRATLENVTMTGVTNGLLIQNYASKTINLKNCDISSIAIWERSGSTGVQTFNFEGKNTVDTLSTSQYAKYVLAAEGATLITDEVEGLNITTTVADRKVVYDAVAYELAPMDYVAQIGEVKFESLQAAIDAAVTGDTITVLKDIDLADTELGTLDGEYDTYFLVEGKNITIDLNGKTISGTYTGTRMLIGVFSTDNGGHLTLTGNGTVDVTATGTVYCLIATYEDDCSITIENGTYTLDKAHDCLIYSGCDEGVTVNGGTFTLGNVGDGTNGKPWIFNCLGGNDRNVTVNGGTFNTDVNHQFWANEVFVPETKALKKTGEKVWTVVDAVAYVEEIATSSNSYSRYIGYATMEEAIEAVKNGMTVTLLADADYSFKLEGKSIILDVNDFAYTGTVELTEGTTLTAAEDLDVITNIKDHEVIYEGGIYQIAKIGAVAVNLETGMTYVTVNEALAEAKSGDTVQLLANTEGDYTMVSAGVTLDLYGYTYEVGYMVVFNGGNIVDNSTSNSGRLAVDPTKFMINEKNAQLPVKTADGYMFVEVIKFNTGLQNGTKFIFQTVFEAAAHEELMKGYASSGVRIMVRVSWTTADGARAQDFVYTDSMVQTVIGSYNAETGKYKKMFTLSLSGIEDITDLSYEVIVASDAGVECGSND